MASVFGTGQPGSSRVSVQTEFFDTEISTDFLDAVARFRSQFSSPRELATSMGLEPACLPEVPDGPLGQYMLTNALWALRERGDDGVVVCAQGHSSIIGGQGPDEQTVCRHCLQSLGDYGFAIPSNATVWAVGAGWAQPERWSHYLALGGACMPWTSIHFIGNGLYGGLDASTHMEPIWAYGGECRAPDTSISDIHYALCAVWLAPPRLATLIKMTAARWFQDMYGPGSAAELMYFFRTAGRPSQWDPLRADISWFNPSSPVNWPAGQMTSPIFGTPRTPFVEDVVPIMNGYRAYQHHRRFITAVLAAEGLGKGVGAWFARQVSRERSAEETETYLRSVSIPKINDLRPLPPQRPLRPVQASAFYGAVLTHSLADGGPAPIDRSGPEPDWWSAAPQAIPGCRTHVAAGMYRREETCDGHRSSAHTGLHGFTLQWWKNFEAMPPLAPNDPWAHAIEYMAAAIAGLPPGGAYLVTGLTADMWEHAKIMFPLPSELASMGVRGILTFSFDDVIDDDERFIHLRIPGGSAARTTAWLRLLPAFVGHPETRFVSVNARDFKLSPTEWLLSTAPLLGDAVSLNFVNLGFTLAGSLSFSGSAFCHLYHIFLANTPRHAGYYGTEEWFCLKGEVTMVFSHTARFLVHGNDHVLGARVEDKLYGMTARVAVNTGDGQFELYNVSDPGPTDALAGYANQPLDHWVPATDPHREWATNIAWWPLDAGTPDRGAAPTPYARVNATWPIAVTAREMGVKTWPNNVMYRHQENCGGARQVAGQGTHKVCIPYELEYPAPTEHEHEFSQRMQEAANEIHAYVKTVWRKRRPKGPSYVRVAIWPYENIELATPTAAVLTDIFVTPWHHSGSESRADVFIVPTSGNGTRSLLSARLAGMFAEGKIGTATAPVYFRATNHHNLSDDDDDLFHRAVLEAPGVPVICSGNLTGHPQAGNTYIPFGVEIPSKERLLSRFARHSWLYGFDEIALEAIPGIVQRYKRVTGVMDSLPLLENDPSAIIPLQIQDSSPGWHKWLWWLSFGARESAHTHWLTPDVANFLGRPKNLRLAKGLTEMEPDRLRAYLLALDGSDYVQRQTVIFFTFGTRGDRVPTRYMAREFASRNPGLYTILGHLLTPAEGLEMLASCEQGTSISYTSWAIGGSAIIALTNCLAIFAPEYLKVGLPARPHYTYTLRPPDFVARRPGAGLGRWDWVYDLLFDKPSPVFHIATYPGFFPRSSDGVRPLIQRQNADTGVVAYTFGSSSLTHLRNEVPDGAIPLPDGDHPELLTQVSVLYCPGGAGITQTAGASGARVVALDSSIDRKYRNPADAAAGVMAPSAKTVDACHSILSSVALNGHPFSVGVSVYWYAPRQILKVAWALWFSQRVFVYAWLTYLTATFRPKVRLTLASTLAANVSALAGIHASPLTWVLLVRIYRWFADQYDVTILSLIQKNLTMERVLGFIRFRAFLATMGIRSPSWAFGLHIITMKFLPAIIRAYRQGMVKDVNVVLVIRPAKYMGIPLGMHTYLWDRINHRAIEGVFVDRPALGAKFVAISREKTDLEGDEWVLATGIPSLAVRGEVGEYSGYSPVWNCTTLVAKTLVSNGGLMSPAAICLFLVCLPWAFTLLALGVLVVTVGSMFIIPVYIVVAIVASLDLDTQVLGGHEARNLLMWYRGLCTGAGLPSFMMFGSSIQEYSLAASTLTALLYSAGIPVGAVNKVIEETMLEVAYRETGATTATPSPTHLLARRSRGASTWIGVIVNNALAAMCDLVSITLQFIAGTGSLVGGSAWLDYKIHVFVARTKTRLKSVWGLTPLAHEVRMESWLTGLPAEYVITESGKFDTPSARYFHRLLQAPIPLDDLVRLSRERAAKRRLHIDEATYEVIKDKLPEFAGYRFHGLGHITERAAKYRQTIPNLYSVDGEAMIGTSAVKRSYARYLEPENTYEDKEREAAVVEAIFAEYPGAFTDPKLTSPDYIIDYMLAKGRKNYSSGFPFYAVPTLSRREQLYNSGWMETIAKEAIKMMEAGQYPEQYYHVFVKSQVVNALTVDAKLRTVTAQDLLSSFVDRIARFEMTDRHYYDAFMVGLGMPTTPGYMGHLAEVLSAREYCASLDVTAFDANLPAAAWRMLLGLIEKGLGTKEHPTYGVSEAQYKAQRSATLIDTHSGALAHKIRGGGTGKSSTSWDNTWSLKACVIFAWSVATGKDPREFYLTNSLHNTGDDNIWSSDDDIEAQELSDAAKILGLDLRVEGSGKITDLTYLGKKFVRGTDVEAYYKAVGAEAPRYTVVTDRKQLFTRRAGLRLANMNRKDQSGSRKFESISSHILARDLGHLDLTYFQPDLYDMLIREWEEDVGDVARMRSSNRVTEVRFDRTFGADGFIRSSELKELVWRSGKPDPRIEERVNRYLGQFKARTFEEVCKAAIKPPATLGAGSAAAAHSLLASPVQRLEQVVGDLERVLHAWAPVWVKALAPGDDGVALLGSFGGGKWFIEPFIWRKALVANPELDKNSFFTLCKLSPYAAAMDPAGFWMALSDVPGFATEILAAPMHMFQGRVVTISLMNVALNVAFGSAAKLGSLVRVILSLWRISAYWLPRYYMLAGHVAWLDTGRPSDVLSSLIKRDQFATVKLICAVMASHLPAEFHTIVGLIAMYPLHVGTWLGTGITLFRTWRILSFLDSNGSGATGQENPWFKFFERTVPVHGLTRYIIDSPTSTMKSTAAMAALLKGGWCSRVILVVPVRSLAVNYRNGWIHQNSWKVVNDLDPAADRPLVVGTSGFLNVLLSGGNLPLDDAIVVIDEAHEDSIELQEFLWRLPAGVNIIAMSGTPEETPFPDWPLIPSCIPAPFTRDVIYVSTSKTEELVAHYLATEHPAKTRALVIVPTYREAASLAMSLNKDGHMSSVMWAGNPVVPKSGHIIATQVADMGVDFDPPVDVISPGLEIVSHQGVLQTVPERLSTHHQRLGRTGRSRPGLAICKTVPRRFGKVEKYPTYERISGEPEFAVHWLSTHRLSLGMLFEVQADAPVFDRFAHWATKPPQVVAPNVHFAHMLALRCTSRRQFAQIYSGWANGYPDESTDYEVRFLARNRLYTSKIPLQRMYDLVEEFPLIRYTPEGGVQNHQVLLKCGSVFTIPYFTANP